MTIMEKYKSGAKMTWNEQFIWIPFIKFAAKILVIAIVFGGLFLIALIVIKLIKLIWLL